MGKTQQQQKNEMEQFAGAFSQLHTENIRETAANRLLDSYFTFMFAYGLDSANKQLKWGKENCYALALYVNGKWE